MRALRRTLRGLVLAFVLLAIAFMLYAFGRNHPEDLPWTRLSLGEPIGMFTGRKVAALSEEPEFCRSLMSDAGIRYREVPALRPAEAQCGYDDAVRFRNGGARSIALAPADVTLACPVAAGLAMWEWNVVQPAARRHFGATVQRIDHFGSYNCRRMYGRASGGWSEHATANAIDVAAFRLSDGARVSVLGDWKDAGAKGAFLREVRDGGCKLFSTVLSPDYNAAHRDHLHMDQAGRGATGWRACR